MQLIQLIQCPNTSRKKAVKCHVQGLFRCTFVYKHTQIMTRSVSSNVKPLSNIKLHNQSTLSRQTNNDTIYTYKMKCCISSRSIPILNYIYKKANGSHKTTQKESVSNLHHHASYSKHTPHPSPPDTQTPTISLPPAMQTASLN